MLDSSAFDYDQQSPLMLHIEAERVQDGAILRDITYPSPRGGTVPAYLLLPAVQPPQAGLIFGHWGAGNREEFVEEALVLTRLGFVSLCLDAPLCRPAMYSPQPTQPEMDIQWITDVRRGVDVVQQAGALSPHQVGYVGHSYGATLGGVLAGIEQRISAFVLMAGWYALSELAATSTVSVLAKARNSTPPDAFGEFLKAMAPLDARHYIGHAAPSQLFFQFARADTTVLAQDGQQYFEFASEPKQIAWYDHCNHELNAQARLDRVTWLCATLHLSPPAPEVVNLLAQIPPPQRLRS